MTLNVPRSANLGNPVNDQIIDVNNTSQRQYKKSPLEKHFCLCSTCYLTRDFNADYYENTSLLIDEDRRIFTFFCKDLTK